ncbi:MAG: methyltransferase, partial [Endozoicomonas sp.]
MPPLSLSSSSQLIIRNIDTFELDHLLMIGLPADQLLIQLLNGGVGKVTALSRDFSDYRRLKPLQNEFKDHFSLTFAPTLEGEFSSTVDGVLLFLQKSKPLMDFWLQMIIHHVPDNVPIWLVGENDEGIKSWKKRLKKSFNHVNSVDNARHCVLLVACEPLKCTEVFDVQEFCKVFNIQAIDQTLTVYSLPGVFSHGRLDTGTKVLLETLKDLPAGKILDFGCGAGVISAYISTLPEEHEFTLVDCDALALASSRKTISALGVKGVCVIP